MYISFLNLMMQTSQFDQFKCRVQDSKMAKKIQLLAIILVISISAGYARIPKKIIKGKVASIREFPYQVSLQRENGFHFCGGSIISSQLILTAAHCIVDKDRNPVKYKIYVVIGTNNKERHTSHNVFRVVRRIHHDYRPTDFHRNDIAILKLNRPLVFNNLARPAKLPLRDVPAGTRVMSTGWGATAYNDRTDEGYNYPRYLQKLERTVVPQKKCQNVMARSGRIGPGQICVQSPNGADSCAGDSGGPLTYKGKVVGIASHGIGCGLKYPDIYTRVHYYLQRIRKASSYMIKNLEVPSNSRKFIEA